MSLQEARRRIKDLKERNLTTLDLAELKLTDFELAELFRNDEFVVLNLQYLFVHNNRLRWIPFSKLKSLQSICLSNNRLVEIPNGISELRNLKYLFIDRTQLENSIETILKLSNLEVSCWNGENYVSVSANIKEIKQKTLEVEASLRRIEDSDNDLKKKAHYLKRFLAASILFLPVIFCLIFLRSVSEGWDTIEPLLVVFSLSLLILSVALGKNFKEWLDDSANELLEKFLLFFMNHTSKKRKNILAEYRELEVDLEWAYDDLISYSVKDKRLAVSK